MLIGIFFTNRKENRMQLILIRHGETYANVLYDTQERILIGALESNLTQLNERGRLQALKTKQAIEQLHIDEIYCSDLGRTKETASIIFPNREIQFTQLLRERSLGSDEGKRAADLFKHEDAWKHHVNLEKDSFEERLTKRVPDGENYIMVMERCRKFLQTLHISEDTTIAVVAHFHLIRCMIAVLTHREDDPSMFDWMIPNAVPLFFQGNEQGFHQNSV